MNNAAFSMKAFAAYLFALGAILLIAPNVLLALFGFPETQEVWIRVVGLLVGVLAAFYWAAALQGVRPLFRLSVFTRGFAFLALTAFALLGLGKPMLALFGDVDLAGALWTFLALKKAA